MGPLFPKVEACSTRSDVLLSITVAVYAVGVGIAARVAPAIWCATIETAPDGLREVKV